MDNDNDDIDFEGIMDDPDDKRIETIINGYLNLERETAI